MRRVGWIAFYGGVLCLIMCAGSLRVAAQRRLVVTGLVSDTAGAALPGAHVRLISGGDTLHSSSNGDGRFYFRYQRLREASIRVSSVGFGVFERPLPQQDSVFVEVVLVPAPSELGEVVIRTRAQPVRAKKDTLEYNTKAYTVRKNDRIEDLLRQLPGIDVDKDGNITTNGKVLTKIRVNGKDFFTGNVRDFIRQIPAELIAKLQVVDDYGDAANFTGERSSAPKKILNLVTKSKRDYGYFGNMNVAGGTNERYDLGAETNIWQEKQHIGLKAGLSNLGSGEGLNRERRVGLNYRNNFGRTWNFAGNYDFVSGLTLFKRETATTTVNEQGTIYNNSSVVMNTKEEAHRLLLDVKSEGVRDFFQAGLSANWARQLELSSRSAAQRGLIMQDLITLEGNRQRAPELMFGSAWSRKLRKAGRLFNLSVELRQQEQYGLDTLRNRITYLSQGPVDSVLNRLLDSRRLSRNLKTGVSYTEPLVYNDSVKSSLGLFYDFAVNSLSSSLKTRTGTGYERLVDSLSNSYGSVFRAHYAGIRYQYDGKKLNYTVRASLQPNELVGDGVRRTDLNVGGAMLLSYRPDNRRQLSMFYFGDNNPPSVAQLQPVSDTRDLQNVVIGNPRLKTAFTHSMSMAYRYVLPGSGAALQADLDGSLVRNQVVTNVRLIPDTLSSLKQETRFLNADGNYQFGGRLNFSYPLADNHLLLEAKGGLMLNNAVVYTDDMRQTGKGIMSTAGLEMRVNQKFWSLNPGVSYFGNSNRYSVLGSSYSRVGTVDLHVSGKVFFTEVTSLSVDGRKLLNSGYGVGSTDPFLLNAAFEQAFLKKKNALIRLQGNDLLAQGNFLNRQVSANSVIDTKSNVLTRYLLLTFILRFEKFGTGV